MVLYIIIQLPCGPTPPPCPGVLVYCLRFWVSFGTLPAETAPEKWEIQGGTLAIFFVNNIELYFVKKKHGKSRTIAPKITKHIDKNMKFLSQNRVFRSLGLLGRGGVQRSSLGHQGRQRRKSEPKGGSFPPRSPPMWSPIWSLGGHFFWNGPTFSVFFADFIDTLKTVAKKVPKVSQKGDILEGVDMPEV